MVIFQESTLFTNGLCFLIETIPRLTCFGDLSQCSKHLTAGRPSWKLHLPQAGALSVTNREME